MGHVANTTAVACQVTGTWHEVYNSSYKALRSAGSFRRLLHLLTKENR